MMDIDKENKKLFLLKVNIFKHIIKKFTVNKEKIIYGFRDV